MTVEHHSHFPWAREYLRIFHCRLIGNVVAICKRVTFCDMQGVAMEVSGSIKPRFFVEIDDINYERIAFPVAARIPHPPRQTSFWMGAAVRIDVPRRMRIFVEDRCLRRRLNNLKRKRHVGDAWNTGQKTSRLRVRARTLFIVRFPLGESLWPIRQ